MEINTFSEYLKEPHSLTMAQMQQFHEEMVEEIGNDPDARELYDDLVDASTKYAAIRAAWNYMSREDKINQDSIRTSYHNSVIIQFNVLARCLRAQGKKAEWRDRLGYEEDDRYFRKTIGDFGCYIVFVNSVCAR
ncbi:hypothetical protein [Frisingicoccus sp.]|uniref:hypothetical protein n=1 Tax=Frisingicoccus sp. TaxID=1918627 RepID=UPI003735BF6F